MKFLILFLIALVISAMGFIKFVWFISLGYGFSIAGLGIAILAMFSDDFTFTTLALTLLLIVYGCRLGSYLLIRERKSASYQKTMKNDIKDGSGMNFFLKLIVWVSCAFLYCCEVSPIFFRMENAVKADAVTVIGLIIMACGIILESAADLVKNIYKNVHPDHFCNVGLFRFVRCPNYLGEVLIWTGVFISGVTALSGAFQWILAIGGWVCIVYIMFGRARRLELRQNKHYGNNPEYQEYVKTTPILLPFVPLYSVAKYKWLVG